MKDSECKRNRFLAVLAALRQLVTWPRRHQGACEDGRQHWFDPKEGISSGFCLRPGVMHDGNDLQPEWFPH